MRRSCRIRRRRVRGQWLSRSAVSAPPQDWLIWQGKSGRTRTKSCLLRLPIVSFSAIRARRHASVRGKPAAGFAVAPAAHVRRLGALDPVQVLPEGHLAPAALGPDGPGVPAEQAAQPGDDLAKRCQASKLAGKQAPRPMRLAMRGHKSASARRPSAA